MLLHTTRSRRLRQYQCTWEVQIAVVQAQNETESYKYFIFSFSWLDTSIPSSGNRWWLVPDGVCLAPVLRLAFTSPWSVLGRLMLCSRGGRVLKRSLFTSHALSVPVSYHHCKPISLRPHTGVSATRALLLARKMARRHHEPACSVSPTDDTLN